MNLGKMGIQMRWMCFLLCCQYEETTEHLFLDCEVAFRLTGFKALFFFFSLFIQTHSIEQHVTIEI